MKILNLYSGIGGNRKLWGISHSITAVEIDTKIASAYQELFPKDEVIIGDAHEYLLKNFRNFDFIWAFPPCISHSSLNFYNYHVPERTRYVDMKLYQEIILLQKFYKGKWVIENVKPYYNPLIPPTFSIDRHLFWSSDFILTQQYKKNYTQVRHLPKKMADLYGYDLNILKKHKLNTKRVLRNVVTPEIGKFIYDNIIEKAKDGE